MSKRVELFSPAGPIILKTVGQIALMCLSPILTRSSFLLVVALLALRVAHADAELREVAIPTQNSGADRIATGPDGALWFTEANAGKIGRITTSGATTEYTATGVRDPESIVSGPQNALWFGQPRAIGRIQTNGEITLFPTPPAGGSVTVLTTGSDGRIWYTARTPDEIVAMATDGTFTEYLLGQGKVPVGIVTGQDGALWFSEVGTNKIARITISGEITEFPLPRSQTEVYYLIVGPDGAIWFQEFRPFDPDGIGRISENGDIIDFPTPTYLVSIGGIATGPDGRIWFTDTNGSAVGRMSTQGQFDLFPLGGPGGQPLGITTGPDGAMWIVEFLANAIGRMDPPPVSRCDDVVPVSGRAVNSEAR
jgi:virginiamycin B lyase